MQSSMRATARTDEQLIDAYRRSNDQGALDELVGRHLRKVRAMVMAGPLHLHTSYSGIQQFGIPSEIYSATIDRAEYAVFQTIVSLEKADDVT